MSVYILLIGVVLTGGLAARWFRRHPEVLPYLTVFSGAYLFAVIVFHLLPEIYGHPHTDFRKAGVFLLAGLLFQIILEHLSDGLEHGHAHSHASLSAGAVAGLFLHAFTEGIPLHQMHSHAYLYGILVHKLPVAIVLTVFLIQSGITWRHLLFFLILFSLMSPLGAAIGKEWDLLRKNHVYVSAFVAGILTHISTVSTVIIFESEEGHRLTFKRLALLVTAFFLAFLGAAH